MARTYCQKVEKDESNFYTYLAAAGALLIAIAVLTKYGAAIMKALQTFFKFGKEAVADVPS